MKRNRILVVDDEDVMRDFIAFVLKGAGYHVSIAEDGVAGFSLWDELAGTIDLIVTDIHMPKSNGIDLINRIRMVDTTRVKILAICGKPTPELIRRVIDAGADAFAEKPFKVIHFLEKVAELLEAKTQETS